MGTIENPYGSLSSECKMEDDPIFIGINRLISKVLFDGEQEGEHIQYPCQVVDRFQCLYEETDSKEDNDPGADEF